MSENNTTEVTLSEESMREVARQMILKYGEAADQDALNDHLDIAIEQTVSDEQVEQIWNLYNTATVRITFREDEHPAIESVLQYTGEQDGKAVIEILTTDKAGEMSDGNPDIRVYVNDGLVYGDIQEYDETEGN